MVSPGFLAATRSRRRASEPIVTPSTRTITSPPSVYEMPDTVTCVVPPWSPDLAALHQLRIHCLDSGGLNLEADADVALLAAVAGVDLRVDAYHAPLCVDQ